MTDDNFDREAARRQNRKVTRSSTVISLIGVALFLLSGVLIYKLTPGPLEKQQSILNSQVATNVSFEMVQKDNFNQWGKLSNTPESGEQISFRISTNQPLHVSLISEPNQSHPRTLFDDIRIPPGQNKIINFNNQDYHYTVKETDKQVQFCLITAADPKVLAKRIRSMQEKTHLSELPDIHCVNW
ncbi:MAG: hypothetical protein L3J89_08765 [Gammaproteobacteria bacterium]|nr:hypothetical protein [Gammaproteobacteria bacterium]